MEEYIDIVDINGIPTGVTAPKSEIHSKGHLHNTAHVWFFTSEGHILLQQRAASKAIYPLLWDVSVAGHIDAGETPKQATVREAKEEIGITITEEQLMKIGVFECFQSYTNGIIDNEFHNTFIAEINVNIEDLTLQKEEVEALKLISIPEFKLLLKNSATNGHFIASNNSYYETVLDEISTILK
ncbi:NUDIX hydrolase [Psychroserpens ponticola]|uniref:NUDIX domain-containing protein n=1 Tax=Psychroserpens ponticola TaxID=2932268 RepID=A0ABY7RTG2_9FLAO|nr:NUDIX domain-containing protein [Psychroserpens ponticola]WCO00397.1 NUDIX domain-containing protein [Psychroserpens ponticola]